MVVRESDASRAKKCKDTKFYIYIRYKGGIFIRMEQTFRIFVAERGNK